MPVLATGVTVTPLSSGTMSLFVSCLSLFSITCYEVALRRVYGRVDAKDTYGPISRKVYAAIGEAYPELKYECERQKQRKFGESVISAVR